MERTDLKKFDLPEVPGVYLFKKGRRVLYIGKATSLRDRVRSYFDDDLIATRGPRIVDMVTNATTMIYHSTPTVLEALVLEAALIKKYLPPANVNGKDDKSFMYAVVTHEDISRVLSVRGKDIDFPNKRIVDTRCPPARMQGAGRAERVHAARPRLSAIYGPFPSGGQLREGLRLIRRIFPFYDTPKPVGYAGKHQRAKIEFNKQIGQYPKAFDAREYARTIRNVKLFLSGRGKELRRTLAREMSAAAKAERFEDAAEVRRELFALDHIQDVTLIRDEHRYGDGYPQNEPTGRNRGYRIEAYDTAHLAGTSAIGVMIVVEDGAPQKGEYRSFNIRGFKKNDDIGSLKEILSRRLGHPEWPLPRAIVVDGGKPQKNAAEAVLLDAGIGIPVAAVVKDERHRPREVIGAMRAGISEADAVLANAEAHRFSLTRHRRARSRNIKTS